MDEEGWISLSFPLLFGSEFGVFMCVLGEGKGREERRQRELRESEEIERERERTERVRRERDMAAAI